MRKLIVLFCVMVLCFSGVAFASQGRVDDVFSSGQTLSLTVPATSRIFNISSSSSFGLWLDLSTVQTVGTVDADVKITAEQSWDKTATNFATIPTIGTLNTAIATIVTTTLLPMKYVRFVVQGTAANSTATTIQMKLFSRE